MAIQNPPNPISGGTQSALNISAATVIKASPGRVATISVSVAGAPGSVNDCITTGAVSAANLIASIPATVGEITLNWPAKVGITVTPGASQVLSISYS